MNVLTKRIKPVIPQAATIHHALSILRHHGFHVLSRSHTMEPPSNRSPVTTLRGVTFRDSIVSETRHHSDHSISLRLEYGWIRLWR